MFADELPGPRAFDRADDQWENTAARQSDLQVRLYRLLDGPAISNLLFRYELHYPESDSDRPGATQLVARRVLEGDHSSRPLFVAIDRVTNDRIGALQCQQRGSDERWTLQYLKTSDVANQENPAPIALLEYAISQAGWHGARRIMARSFVDSPLTGALRSTGFSAFTHEYIYALPRVPVGDSDRSVRIQENSDVWGIHQLYLQTTPREVQNAEALTSHEWDVDLEGRSRRGWLMTSDSGPNAYVRVRTTRKCHRLDVMFEPEARQVLPTLLGAVFDALRNDSSRPVYVSVRGYQQEMESALTNVGFELDADQLMMVRYTTVQAPARGAEAFELLRPAEADARRVPSFYVRDVHE